MASLKDYHCDAEEEGLSSSVMGKDSARTRVCVQHHRARGNRESPFFLLHGFEAHVPWDQDVEGP
ncbi:unnamed protein product [Cylicostephanus goldi]|uniref:Uncharacterized protein n=1 Tax=Cylicostephanus goldi TaxID=71465 RepID=A0A3P6REI1_CYLGO|nr:unnamed protein product [Cylicostephanus goldi]